MVERVHRTVSVRLAYAADHERLDALRLDLHVNSCLVADGVENRVQRGNLHAVREREPARDVAGREIDDASGGLAGRVDHRIVVYDHDSIACGVNVELDRVRAKLYSAEKRRDGVLRDGLVRATVGDPFRRGATGRSSQEFSVVVVLGTMRAKL
jgi:hypothetical protein